MPSATIGVQANVTPYVGCVFEAIFGESRQEPLHGSGQLLDQGEPFKVALLRQRGALVVNLPAGRDLMEDLAFVFPFDSKAECVIDWPRRPSFEGPIGSLHIMGEIVGVNERFTLMVVHSLSRAGLDLNLRESVLLIVPTARTETLKCIEGASDE